MENVTKTARTLLMVAVMIASAILPMVPEAAELRDEARAMGASISTDVTTVTLDEGGWTMYEVSLDEAPDGTLVITPSSDNSAVTVDPSYLKFTKVNWDMPQWVYVDIVDTDDDGADTTATISHSISGTDTVFSAAPGDLSVTGTDYDTDTDGDGLHDGLDTDDDGDGVDDTAEDAGCDLLADCDGDGVNDDTDAFDTDATEDTDTDGDGVGDNADAFDTDATEDTDTDGDGVGDNADAFPDDATETADTDGDGVGDNADAFPSDATEWEDYDGDGTGNNSDAFPDDATEDTDTDGDGVGDNADTDDDGDGVDDTAEDAGCDLLADCDGDGVNDDTDAFDTDANATTDTDGDGAADDISVTGAVYDFDFEDGSLSTHVTWELSQCDGSDSSCVDASNGEDWSVSDWDAIDGTYSLRSGNLSTNYQNLNISVTFTSADGTMSFDYSISSLCRDYTSTYYDGFRLYVDGALVANPSDGGTACSNGVWGGTVDAGYDTSHAAYSATHFMCADGTQGFSNSLTSWVGDGWDDCSDGSDEDSSYTAGWYTAGMGIGPVSGTHEEVLTAGTHTVIFQFHGGTSSAAGLSLAWIDNLVIPVAAGTAGSTGPTTTTDGTAIDNDDDNDGYSDTDETTNCETSTDPLNSTDFPMYDNDGDYSCDAVDDDDDDDGVLDADEADGSALDLDGDGTADGINCANSTDCDGDGVGDATDTHPVDPTETTDMDGDGIGDNGDNDRDGDGYLNTDDAFPDDDTEWTDNDGDGTGDNADTDDDTCPAADGADTDGDGTADATCDTFTGFGSWVDADGDGVQDYDFYPGDGVLDVDDWDPTSPAETADNDGDGWGDNADYDDDDDGIADDDDDDMDGDGFDNDDEDTNCVGGLSDPQDGTDTPADMDGDGTCDALDVDMDGDGTNGTDQGDGAVDAFDDDACADTDTDGDGLPDSIVTGCTTTLTEDSDDDYVAGSAPADITECDSSTDTGYSYIPGTTWSCTFDLSAGDTMYFALASYYSTIYVAGSLTGPSSTLFSFSAGSSASSYAGTYGPYTEAGTYTFSVGSDPGYYTVDVEATITPGSAPDWTDAEEATCGTDPQDSSDEPTDTDGDGLCDDFQDDDNDGDGWTNDDESTNCFDSTTSAGTDPLDDTDAPSDNDADGTCDYVDTDDDDDGTLDADDAFSTDACADTDTDGDGSPDSVDETDADADGTADCVTTLTADTDDDGDGTADANDAFPLDACADTDTDGDGSPDSVDETDADADGTADCVTTLTADTDDDDDGVLDADEEDGSGLTTPVDCTLVADCDSDGVADSLEDATCAIAADCDGDGVNDDTDAFDLDATETTDTDGDGTGDNADTDDDADGFSDADETTNCDTGTYASTGDPLDGSDTPADNDGDGTCDALDNDIDGDDIPNPWDQCPTDPNGYIDTDNDGLCDGDSDDDDDGDGTLDADDAFPLDGSETTDTDGDGIGNNGDADDDNDGTDDQDDECPLDASGITDNDGDGACDASDTDDDDDTVLDADEEAGCEFDSDCDGDGVLDAVDAFDNNANATVDTDGDGLTDSFDANAPAAVTYTIDTQGYGDLTVIVFTNSAVADCVLDTSGPGGSGSDYPATDGSDAESTDSDSCTVTSSDGISIVVENSAYITYYGAFFGYNTPNIDVTVDGTSVGSLNAQYSWYTTPGLEVWSATPELEGVGLDNDDDGDGYSDADEDTNCVGDGGDSLDSTATPDDNEGDGDCDYLDGDDDNDGYSDEHEGDCGTDPTVADDVVDFDGDGVCDSEDADDDDDGTDDGDDWMPYDSSEWADTDNDGVGDNADDDADGDGTADSDDSDPTDRCSSTDTDGDGLTDSYDDCSTMGFYTTLDSDAGDNAGEGFDDGDFVGITDDTSTFWGAGDGDQWFAVSDTDGLFSFYADHATGVSALGMLFALSSTDWEVEDYLATYWVGDDGVTTELFNSADTWGDLDNCQCEGFWLSWTVEVPSEDGYMIGVVSTDSDAEIFGVDNIAYFDNNWETLEVITFEDSVEDMGVYTTPSSPSLLAGTYTIDIADSWGDGGQSATAMHDGTTFCDITTDTNGASDSCTFTITGYSDTDIEVDFTTDLYASEGSMDITFPDGTVSSYTPSASYATDSYSFAHTGTEVLPMEGTYNIEISDLYGDGGQEAIAWFDGVEVCSITTDGANYGLSSVDCTFTETAYADSTLDVDFTSTDTWGTEGTMVITFPDGTTQSYGNSADYATDSYSFAHTGTDVQPVVVAGEVALSNGHGATVSIDVSAYHTGTEDSDDDNDGWDDADDAFPLDDTEWDDMDGDGIGSNADNDDDGDGTNDGWDDFPRHAHADTDTDGDGMPDQIGWIDGEIGDDFELGNFSGMDDYSTNGWDRSGDSLFGLASGTAFDGYAARAGIISDNESSTLELEVYTSEGYVSFDYMVSSEERYDTLSFSIDGMEYMSASGQDYHWEFICTTAGAYTDTAWEANSLNDGSIPGNWVNDGFADCGDSDGDGTSDDEGLNNWYSLVEGSFTAWVGEGNHTFSWTYAKDGSAAGGNDRAYFDNVVIPFGIMGDGECSDGTDDCNIEDLDDDNDGVEDLSDDCPTDSGEQIDSDGDGWCDNADADDDNDGTYDYNDEDDDLPYDDSDCNDMDGDGVGDLTDPDDDGDNVMDVDDPFPLDGSAWADNDGDGIPDYTGDPPFLGNFEGGAIPAGWTTYGDADWFVCGMGSCGNPSTNPINGSYMAESGDIDNSETSSVEVTMDTFGGDVSFDYETSTEGFWDYLRFYVDGSLTQSWSGVTSGTFTTTVSSGWHTFQWMYYKDASVSSNADTVWIDDVSLPISQNLTNDDLDDDNDGVYDEMDLDPTDPCVSLDTDGDGQPDTVMTGIFDMSGTGDANFTVDCDMSMWSEDWDDDGDGWSDEEEWLCGSNHLDGEESPWDFDQDWVCDDLDDDLDNDGAVNPVNNCELYLGWGDSAAFIDCIADGFHAVDVDGDGDASQMELMHAWAFQWGGPDDDGDGDDDCDDDEDDWDDDGDDGDGGDDGGMDSEGIGSRDGHDNGTDNGTDDGGSDDNGTDDGDDMDDNGTDDGDGMDDNGTGDGDGMDDNGTDDGEGPGEPDVWPSQEDIDAFNADFWDFVSAWDADNSTSLSFDEYWQIITDTEDDFDFANPGWSEDTTEWDQFPFDASEQVDTDMDGMGDNSDGDDDNDGTPDSLDAFPYDPTEDADLDGDGIGDNSDNDTDGDGIDNDNDDFDSDPTAAADNDGDGIDDASDSDDDNDGVPDVADWAPMDSTEQYDTDGDGIGDNADTDDDGDGVEDGSDAFPLDASESADADMDGVGDIADPDDDNDGTPDGLDAFPNDANEQRDYDGDGIGDVADADRDEDGYLNSDDAFPMNENEWLDTDGDNVGDNSDSDIDGDSVLNADDWAPLDAAEWDDTDGDGTGDNADDNDDGDAWNDADEYSCGTDSKSAASVPSDFDGDGICDALDDSDDRSQADKDVNAQEAPGFTPGFASVLAVMSLLGAAMLGRRKDD